MMSTALTQSPWLAVQCYFWPYLIEQEEKRVFLALRNAAFTVLAAPGFTLGILVVAAAMVLVSLATVAPLGVATMSMLALLGNHAILNRLQVFGKRPTPKTDIA